MLYFDRQIFSFRRAFPRTCSRYRKGLAVIDNIEESVVTSLDRLDRIGVRL